MARYTLIDRKQRMSDGRTITNSSFTLTELMHATDWTEKEEDQIIELGVDEAIDIPNGMSTLQIRREQ